MSNRFKGDAAFPQPISDNDLQVYADPGMTLRDYFATRAMQSWLLRTTHNMVHPVASEGGRTGAQVAAKIAYHIADAMLAERENQP